MRERASKLSFERQPSTSLRRRRSSRPHSSSNVGQERLVHAEWPRHGFGHPSPREHGRTMSNSKRSWISVDPASTVFSITLALLVGACSAAAPGQDPGEGETPSTEKPKQPKPGETPEAGEK